MNTLRQETRNVQNPGLGAVLLWRFACGYVSRSQTSSNPPFQVLFIVLPIVLHRETLEIINGTNRPSGLHGFADKFSRAAIGKSDLLLGIQSRALQWRELTLESLNISIATRLLTISTSDATVVPITTTSISSVPQSTRPLLRNSEKLGEWCSELSLFEVGTILKVGF